MNKDEINLILKREIKNGTEFNYLISKPINIKKPLETGDTFYTVKTMKTWVEQFYKQVTQLAFYLKSSNIQETCHNIHRFLYNNIQYQADGVVQNLRSPADSWKNRILGIDCKSYSIFASCILTNLGIKHYIRQIKQPNFNPKQFTHVYVIVPINQATGGLENGSYCIDGTLKNNIEPLFIKKEDCYMDKLPHIGLACPVVKTNKKPSGLKGTTKKKNITKSGSTQRNRFPFN